MTITIVDPEGTIEHEIAMKCPQAVIASTYGLAIIASNLGEKVDYVRMNRAIAARWPKGLQRVKALAWKFVERTRPDMAMR
jgi:hypothetical protein